MSTHRPTPEHVCGGCSDKGLRPWAQWFARGGLRGGALLTGIAALAWLLLRSGPKPARVAYPCQQAALSTAGLSFAVPLVGALRSMRRGMGLRPRHSHRRAVAVVGLVAVLAGGGLASLSLPSPPRVAPPPDYRAQVFHVSDCPRDSVGDRFVGLDDLLSQMGREGLKFYKSPHGSLLAGSDGIVSADDVVIIKINYQWAERGGTNMDLLRGLIHRVLTHPDGFSGEVVVCENAQFVSTSNFDRNDNNAQDITMSPLDVVSSFRNQGAAVSHFDWTIVRGISVAEYDTGDIDDGYVVYPHDARWNGRLSYPKFRTQDGSYVSLRDGVWDTGGAQYDRERLTIINVPVLKSHHAVYGLTACTKHYMGVVTQSLSTNAHTAVAAGILGGVMGEIAPPDLNILDCIWVGADPYSGPWSYYGDALRRDALLASTDPIAADRWAAANILIPAFEAAGFSPPWPVPSADPEDPAGKFREYLDNSMAYLLAAGYAVTNDPARIDAYSASARADHDRDGDVDLREYAAMQVCGAAGGAMPPGCADFDLSSNGVVDAEDVMPFTSALTGPAPF